MAGTQAKKPNKIFNDPIHGSIELHPYLVRIIDTPQFQRLRYIRQMGSVYFVYPGASHNRFEHSIGVAHLAGELVQALNKQYRDHPDPELTEKILELQSADEGSSGQQDSQQSGSRDNEDLITEEEGMCVQIAALCHDLGHGPFSHMFDDQFLPRAAETADEDKKIKLEAWTHEKQSICMLTALIADMKEPEEGRRKLEGDDELIGFMEKNLPFIEELIDPPKHEKQYTQRLKALHDAIMSPEDPEYIDRMKKTKALTEKLTDLNKHDEQFTNKLKELTDPMTGPDQTMEKWMKYGEYSDFMKNIKTRTKKLIHLHKDEEQSALQLMALIDDIKKRDQTKQKSEDLRTETLQFIEKVTPLTKKLMKVPKKEKQLTAKLKRLTDDIQKPTPDQTMKTWKEDPKFIKFMKRIETLTKELIDPPKKQFPVDLKTLIDLIDDISVVIKPDETKDKRMDDSEVMENMGNLTKELNNLLKKRTNPKSFLYEIVSNKRNGIDVDKMDYFARDCYHLGIQSNFDHKRFLKFARVCLCDDGMQICMRDKEVHHIYELFHTRNNIHKKACQHKVVTAIDEMIVEALLKADETLNISDSALDVEKFLNLTDGIYQKILDHKKDEDINSKEEAEKMEEARKILLNIKNRDLYKCVHEARFKDGADLKKFEEDKKFLDNELAAKIIKMTYGMGGKDPIEQVKFYRKRDLCKAELLEKHEVSRLLPKVFAENLLHFICKSPRMSDEEICSFQEKAKEWCRDKTYL